MFALIHCNDFVVNTGRSDDFDIIDTHNVLCRVPVMLSCRGGFQQWIQGHNVLPVPSAELNELLMYNGVCATSKYVGPFVKKYIFSGTFILFTDKV